MNPLKFRMAMDYLTRIKKIKPDLPDVFPASQAPIPPIKEDVKLREAVNRFVRDNPRQQKAGGGMLVKPGFGGVRQGYAGKDQYVISDELKKKIKEKIKLKPGQKWNFYNPETGKGHTFGVKKSDDIKLYDRARTIGTPGRAEKKLKQATEKYKEIKANPKLLSEKKAYDRELYASRRSEILENRRLKYETDKDYREKKLEWAKQDRIKNPEKYKQKVNDYFAKKGRFPPGNNYKENVWRDMFRSSQKLGQERFLLVDEKGNLLTKDKFPKVDGKVRWDVGGAYKKIKFYDTVTKQFVKLDNSIKGKGIIFEKYLDQKSVGGKGAYKNAINGYKNKDDIRDLTFKDSKGKTIRLGTIVQQRLNDGVNYINSGVNVQHPDLNNAFWKNEVTLASANNKLNNLEMTLERQLRNAGDNIVARKKALNTFSSEINKQPGGITKIIEGETLGVKPTAKSVVEAVGKETKLTRFKDFQTLLASLGDGSCAVQFGPKNRDGGRIGYATGTASFNDCIESGAKNFNDGKFKTADQVQDAAKILRGGRAVISGLMKYGIIPELAYVGLEAAGRTLLGEKPTNSLLKSIDTLTFGATDFGSGIEAEKFGKFSDQKLAVDKFRNSQALVNSLQSNLKNLETISNQGGEDYIGDLSADIQVTKERLQKAQKSLQENTVSPDILQFIDRKGQEIADTQLAKSLYSKAGLKDQLEGIPGISDYTDTEPARIFPKQREVDLNLDMFPQFSDATNFMQLKTDDAIDLAQSYRSEGKDVSAKDLLAYRDLLRNAPLSELAKTYGDEQIYGTQGADVLQPLAGGGIAKLAGVDSGPPPTSGPNSQGLQGLMKRVKRI